MDSSHQLVQKLWNYCNILRDDGLSCGDYPSEFPGEFPEFPGTVYSNSQFRRGKGEKSKFSIGYNHDKASLDIFWLRDESLEESDNLPAPDVSFLEAEVDQLVCSLYGFTREEIAIIEESLQEKTVAREVVDDSAFEESQ